MPPKKTYEELEKQIVQLQRTNTALNEKIISYKTLTENHQFRIDTILNNLNSSIYISDMKSYEILFMNKYMKKLFGKDLTNTICWKSIHNDQNAPCSFCTNDKLVDSHCNSTGPYVWEFFNKKLNKWYELQDQAIPWVNGKLVRMEIATDITVKKQTEQELADSCIKLEKKVKERTYELEEINTALKVLLKKIENDKNNIKKQIYLNIKTLITPYLKKLSKTSLNLDQKTLLEIVKSNTIEIISPISSNISISSCGLTITEIKIANLIKKELKTKEIADILNLSPRTVDKHREGIRKKLSIKNKKINLQAHLILILISIK